MFSHVSFIVASCIEALPTLLTIITELSCVELLVLFQAAT